MGQFKLSSHSAPDGPWLFRPLSLQNQWTNGGPQDDTAEHTLAWCTAWTEERTVLKNLLEIEDVTLPRVIGAALESRAKWAALTKFARSVMTAKESAERERHRLSGPARFRAGPPPRPSPHVTRG